MDALRVRFGSVLEWAVAATFFAATLAVASLILRDVRGAGVRPAAPAPVVTIRDIPSSVPRNAVSLPVLALADGKTVRVGDSVTDVSATLGRGAETGREQADQGRLGERLTRFYDYGGFRFVLVYEPFERNGERRVSAIYLP
ncbi:MAG TPA: hypothetical protein VFZ98_07765 [Vicinamibacterales bacterium]